MKSPAADDLYNPQQTQERLRKIMRGAFAGPPTQMKNIPKRNGESRRSAIKKRRKNA